MDATVLTLFQNDIRSDFIENLSYARQSQLDHSFHIDCPAWFIVSMNLLYYFFVVFLKQKKLNQSNLTYFL